MSIFDKADQIASDAFSLYQDAAAAYEAARAQAGKYPVQRGLATPERRAAEARAQADLIEAEQAFKTARKRLEASTRDILSMRDEIAKETANKTVLQASQVDQNALTLIRSGIMKAADYRYMMEQAADNPTMTRLLAKSIQDAADTVRDPGEARELRLLAAEARKNLEDPELEAFDTLAGVYQRCVKNPAMMPRWSEFVKQCREAAKTSES